MRNSITTVLVGTLLATASLAFAQTTTTAPATRAEVKSGITRDTTNAGEKSFGELPKTPGNTSGTTRAEVKSDIVRDTRNTGEKSFGEPPKPGTMSNTTRANVKAGVDRTDRELSTGEKAAAETPSKAAAKRKAMRQDRRAMNKSKSNMKAADGSTVPMAAPEAPTNK